MEFLITIIDQVVLNWTIKMDMIRNTDKSLKECRCVILWHRLVSRSSLSCLFTKKFCTRTLKTDKMLSFFIIIGFYCYMELLSLLMNFFIVYIEWTFQRCKLGRRILVRSVNFFLKFKFDGDSNISHFIE